MFDLAPVNALVEQLQNADIRADLDPATLNLPGVWVQVVGFKVDTLTKFKADLRLQLLVHDTDAVRAQADLLDLARKVNAAGIPVRTAIARTVVLPDGTPLPALQVPTAVRGDLTP
ncbi:hypothetical protein ACJ5H2_05930 [Nocardioides sp. R1-1]|uniref:hypothetical protein n=1 Tax=Nocardioides sp. R1-1 TaxID=3383502 RepID=UPI0038D04A08